MCSLNFLVIGILNSPSPLMHDYLSGSKCIVYHFSLAFIGFQSVWSVRLVFILPFSPINTQRR